jgi:hypothetical protein
MIQVKYKTLKGGWKWLTCTCCKQLRTFKSFRSARLAAENQFGEAVRTKCYKIEGYDSPKNR